MNIKTFAQQSRSILLKGVSHKLFFWGFSPNGEYTEEPVAVPGGYLFRGEAYDDPSIPARWRSLKAAIKSKGFDGVVEEAAYTWFNRFMAIRILAKNGYDLPQLEYADGQLNVPVILHRARRGTYPFLNNDEKRRLQNIISDFSMEQQAFGILITAYCHSHQLLMRVFGGLDDYTEMLLPDDILSPSGFLNLLNTTDAISDEEYRKVELIGWLYQFYISEKKDEVFKKFKRNQKAEAADIPAATQIFTPNWIVKYMVENTVGKIWLDLHPNSPLREKMKYLVENATQNNNPESTERWLLGEAEASRNEVAERSRSAELPFPETNSQQPKANSQKLTANSQQPTAEKSLISEIAQLKLLDPASGSGHILVEGFDLLFEMYREEYYSDAEAVESILKNNLFGLDIDKRAAQLAQFAVLLKAASRFPDVLKTDWQPQIFAMPDTTDFSTQEMMDFLGSDGQAFLQSFQEALELMKQSQNLGSVMQFNLSDEARKYIVNRFNVLKNNTQRSFHEEVTLKRLHPYVAVLEILTNKYEAIAANPPYMGQKNMNNKLKKYVNEHYPVSKSDLFAVFMEVMIDKIKTGARMSCITMESWMFLSSYEKLRKNFLDNYSIAGLVHFGWHIIGIAFGTVLLALEKSKNINLGDYSYLTIDDVDRSINVPFVFPKKNNGRYSRISQSNFSKIPGSPIAYFLSPKVVKIFGEAKSLVEFAYPKQGIATSDNNRFRRDWFEISLHRSTLVNGSKWVPYNSGGGFRKWYGNQNYFINWENDGKEIKEFPKSVLRSPQFYFKECISWSKISAGGLGVRAFPEGFIFDVAGCSIFEKNKGVNTYLLGLLNSNLKKVLIESIAPTLNYEVGQISNIPVIYKDNVQLIALIKSCIELSRLDWNARETSWDFQNFPLLNEKVNLLIAYESWYNQSKEYFFNLHANEVEINRIFIEIYGLYDELTPEVALKDITILQDELDFNKLEKLELKFRKLGKDAIELPIKKDEVMRQLISYTMGVFMGRYRLDKPGLHIAHPAPAPDELIHYSFNNQTVKIDEDAIIPLMGSRGAFSDDALLRFKHFLELVWGEDTFVENLNFLQTCLDEDIETYLVNNFWKDHTKRYKKKPIYWLFSSPKGAFQVLVYMHRMNAFTVDKIRGNYLMEHLKFLRNKIQRLESGSGLSTADARKLESLRADLDECERYDVILKTIADRQITFDLDDGVTTNYKLFEGAVAEIK